MIAFPTDKAGTYLAGICARLANLGEELQGRHPFICAKSCLSCKVVQVDDKPLEEILQSQVVAFGVDGIDIVGDVFDG
jgi:hypothetical protein